MTMYYVGIVESEKFKVQRTIFIRKRGPTEHGSLAFTSFQHKESNGKPLVVYNTRSMKHRY